MSERDDPVVPAVTFDSYIVPQTVQRETKVKQPLGLRRRQQAKPDLKVSGMMLAVSVIAMLAFVLGVMGALKFASPDTPVAGNPQTQSAVTRAQSPDLTSTAMARSGLTTNPPAGDAGLLQPNEALTAVISNKMRMLREGVMAGVYNVTEREEDGVKRLVLTTINAELTRSSKKELLREAAQNGQIKIANLLGTASGGVDTDTMLFYVIQSSLMNDGTPESVEAAREMSRRAFAASQAKTKLVNGRRVYDVQPGDSLASLSLQFYGRPSAYERILEANRDLLGSPDGVRTGQRLIIP